jgi:hypothetical protein
MLCFRSISDFCRLAQYDGHNLSYVFIAYTAEQFNTPEDFGVLHQMADVAARNAGVIAYWVGCSCMPDNQLEEDVSGLLKHCELDLLTFHQGLPHMRRHSRRAIPCHRSWSSIEQPI